MKRTKRQILLAVVGLSPQVVTETLYALTKCSNVRRFIPSEIHLITTLKGAELIQNKLLDGGKGYFYQLLNEYPELGTPTLTEKQIHIIKDDKGQSLSDLRSINDNTHLANKITAVMSDLTSEPDTRLHVSIAGGRKTMGFYLGYIFSLFARAQDQLSHVLVNPPFENHPDFYFPPKRIKKIKTLDGDLICTSKAQVVLAYIPVVKLRYVHPKKIFASNKSFSALVSALQESYKPPQLYINLHAREINCGQTKITLAPALLAWFCMWAKRAKQEKSPISWRDLCPQNYLYLYAIVVGEKSASYENACSRLKDGMSREFFRESNSKLKRALEKQLGPAAKHYTLTALGNRPYTRYALTLKAEEIILEIDK